MGAWRHRWRAVVKISTGGPEVYQVYPHDRGQNYSIALAERLVNRIIG